MTSTAASERATLSGGLDLLRVLAIAAVTAQHAFAMTGHVPWTMFYFVNLGQSGVAIFLGISAFLGSLSSRSPIPWLIQRLRRLYPAYWLAMLLSFGLTWASGYKKFGAYQFVSQMLGLGLFTHASNLINLPTWFISLLITCYVGLFVARLTPRPLIITALFAVATAVWVLTREDPWPWMHYLTFFSVSTLTMACPIRQRAPAFLMIGLVLLVGSWWSVAFTYAGLTFITIGAAMRLREMPRFITKVSSYSYEYYLLHGIFLVGVSRLSHDNLAVVISVGVMLSVCAAIVLKWFVSRQMAWSGRESMA